MTSRKGDTTESNHQDVFGITNDQNWRVCFDPTGDSDSNLTRETSQEVSATGQRDDAPPRYPTTFEKFTSCRYRLCYMMILCSSLIQSQQNNMSFALVCMTTDSGGLNRSESVFGNVSSLENLQLNTTRIPVNDKPEFSWDSATQGLILSSTFYGALVSPFISSVLSRKFGPKLVIGLAMCISGVSTLLTPISARQHLYLVLVCRIVMGFFLNMILPASMDLWAHWAPLQDKAQLLALTFTENTITIPVTSMPSETAEIPSLMGNNIANIVTFTTSGFLCTIPLDNGWPFIFYVFGCSAVCWCLLWCLVVHNTPESHPTITEKEKHYITQNRKGVDSKKKPQIPWKALLTSPPVWAYVFVFFCHLWTASLMFNFLPMYMSTVLDFEITENGLLSSVPYVTRLIGMVTWTLVSGALIRRLSVTATRKTIQTVGCLGAAVLSLGIIFVPVDTRAAAVVLFALLTPLQGASVSGGMVTTLDFAPQFASVTTAFGTVAAVLAQLLAPQVTSFIIVGRTKDQWNIAFYLNIGIYILAIAVFLIFGSGELQPWAVSTISFTEPKPVEPEVHYNKAFEPDTNAADIPGKDGGPSSVPVHSTYL